MKLDDNLKLAAVKERLPVATAVSRELRRMIVEGVYQPHAYLPAERELAKEFRTSRVTVAAALAELEREGLVSRSAGRGTRVLPIMDRVSQSSVGVVHGELPSMEDVARQDSLRTLQGIRDTLERLGHAYKLVTASSTGSTLSVPLSEQFGSLILIEGSHGSDLQLEALEQRKYPVVVAKLEHDLEVAATIADHREPMRQAVEAFVGLGHRRIAFIGRDENFGLHGQARAGYLAGLQEAGIAVEESLLAVCEKTDALSGYFAARSLLQSPRPPSAIVAARDSIAEGVWHAIEEAGLIVGRQVSLIGFDDTTWPEGKKCLTTFREPCYEMGATAAEMLVQRIVQGWSPPEKRKFESAFVLRRSAGPYLGD